MNQSSKISTDARLQEIERKLSLLVDFVCGGRTPADLQAERLGSEFKKFRSQLGFGTEMLLQIESALTPHKNEAQFIEAGLPSVPDILADLSCSISNAFMPSDPGPEVIGGDIPSLPDMFSAILRQLGHEHKTQPAVTPDNEAAGIPAAVATGSGAVIGAATAMICNAIAAAADQIGNELGGVSASLAPGYVGEQAPKSMQDKLDVLAAAFLSVSEKLDRHEESIGKLASILQQNGGGDAIKH